MFLTAFIIGALSSSATVTPTDSVRRVSASARGDSVVYKRPEEIRIPVRRARTKPVLDGRLDDEVWQEALPLDRFVQYEPVDAVLPPQPSIGRVAYDGEFLYIGFRAFERSRDDIRATIHPRERGGELDDKIAMSVDTYNDNRRTYVFRVSPANLQFDGVKTEGQRTDDTPDFVWYSAARIDSLGWTVEAAIPFASLRLPPSDSLDFGFDLVRYHGKAGVRSSWSPRRRGNPCDICQQGTLVGLGGVELRRTVDLLPYVSGTEVGLRAFGADSAFYGGKFQPTAPPRGFSMENPRGSIGGDLRVALTPSTTLNATFNPDFSQVESDDEQVRVNQRFALFFQERRPFFLESRDVFDVSRSGDGGGGSGGDQAGGQLLYTRAIVDPSAGGRITGKSGATQYGVLYARDDAPAWFYYDGYESGGVVANMQTRGDAVVGRVRRDILSDSWIGGSFLGRTAGTSRSSVAELDFSLRRKTIVFSAEGAVSNERAPGDSLLSSVFDGRERSGGYYTARLSQSGRNFNWNMSAAGLSPEYRNQLGRYSRVGVESFTGRLAFDQYPNGALIQKVSQSLSVSRTNAFGAGLLDYSITPRFELTFKQRAGFNVSYMIERQAILGVPLHQRGVFTDFRLETSRFVQFGGFFYGGDRELYDPANPRVSKGIFASLRMTIRPVPQASLEVRGQQSNHYDGWDGALVDDAKIVRLRGTYQVSRRLGMRLIGEYSDQFNTLVSNPVNERAIRYASSLLVTYELAPASFLYAGYNDLMQSYEQPVVTRPQTLRTGNQFFLKMSYLFRL
ncbi:MAG: carbohydrate binding family 9 domain-containing protein [Gemmatimonadetes bacterium]|nr:carbohydrate binding family 9 domain-containing protein [Gemmatimonadota bacterium]